MSALLPLLLLLAPADKQWSKKHGVGVWIPKEWTVVARDQGDRALVFEGPKLGPSVPHAVLWNAGVGDLEQVAQAVAKKIAARSGWQIVARVRKRIGPFPCVRIGIRFVEDGAKGRARVTVALLGATCYVLELSAAASHFPGRTFDRIEQSLEVPWKEQKLPGGLTFKAPAGWRAVREANAMQMVGPHLALVILQRDRDGLDPPPAAKPGPKISFLGRRRATLREEREFSGEKVRLLLVHADGWTGAVRMPVSAWEDLFPVAEAILKTARVKEPK